MELEEYVVETLKDLRDSLDQKETFLEAVSSIKALLLDCYPYASSSLRNSIYEAVCYVASTLETRYTECEFWLAGKMLFEEAERQVADSSEREYLKTCIAKTYEHLDETVNQPEVLDSVLDGQLPMDPVPSRPTLQVAQELLATLGVVAGISLGMREDSNTSQRASDLMEEMVNSMEDVSGFQDIIQSIEASLQGISRPIRSPPASKKVIEKLPVITISEEIMARLGNDMECAVCREKFDLNEKMHELPCKHMFHLLCLKPWLGSVDFSQLNVIVSLSKTRMSTTPVQSADMSCQQMMMSMRVGSNGRGRPKRMGRCCKFTSSWLIFICLLT